MTARAYDRTPADAVEVKRLPPLRAYETDWPRGGGRGRNEAFGRLFRYLKQHDLKMTSPVEVEEEERMRFILGPDAEGAPLPDEGPVRVHSRPARTVVSAGLRGGYGKRVAEGERAIRDYLDHHPEWRAVGPPEVAYWHGPMMPSPLRRFEVHVPVERVDPPPRI